MSGFSKRGRLTGSRNNYVIGEVDLPLQGFNSDEEGLLGRSAGTEGRKASNVLRNIHFLAGKGDDMRMTRGDT